jgi:uncharacterized protein YjbI with pentapeptide repeats
VRAKRGTAFAVTSVSLGMLLLLGVAAGCDQRSPRVDDAVTVPEESKEELERAKLAAEIASLEAADEERGSVSVRLLRWAPFVTALVGVAALVAAVVKQGSETRQHRSKELAERQAERTRRYDQTLSAVVTNLGAGDDRVRLNAAASLAPLLRLSGPDGTEPGVVTPWAEAVPVQDLLPVFIANLRVETDEDVRDILVRNLGLSLVKLDRTSGIPDGLDLTRVRLRRLRIPGIEIPGVDLAFSELLDSDLSGVTAKRLRGLGADLSRSRFTGANLQEARLNACTCLRTRFHRAQLVSATFKGADLATTQFHQARLQGAHFEEADCTGAVFTGADVADAWFCDGAGGRAATFDEAALRTLARARNWRAAHLPAGYRQYLEQVSAVGSST